MSWCSPSHAPNVGKTDTCFSPDELSLIANIVDIDPATKNMKDGLQGINLFIMTGLLHSHFNTQIGQELSWLQKDARLPKNLRSAFRANWINSETYAQLDTDIIWRVLEQYEKHKQYSFFTYLGTHPLDFSSMRNGQCISQIPVLCSLTRDTFKRQYPKKTDFAIVINMDPHTLPGTHWVALYCCFDTSKPFRYGINYYDSLGKGPPAEIEKFMSKLQASFQGTGDKPPPINCNNIMRQKGGIECGVYCIAFIVNCLTTKLSFQDICIEHMPHDKTVIHSRKFLFH
jgi:hypothetical protein